MLTDVYLICAVVGGAVVLAQLVLSVLGGAGHGMRGHGRAMMAHRTGGSLRGGLRAAGAAQHRGARMAGAAARPVHAAGPAAHGVARGGVHHAFFRDHWAIGYLLGLFNFQGMIAGLAVLGLAGLALSAARVPGSISLAVSLLAGLVMMGLVATVLRLMISMDHDGTVRIDGAVGQIGTVYLTVPPSGQGQGKVTVTVQHQLMEFAAVTTSSAPLPTGQKVFVIAVRAPSVMEVVSAEDRLRDLESLSQAPPAP